ncbi:hypothetical protein XENOCAPTIV_021748 [Xenoophorus captivus]|uniref:Uncharacterized protein n=1 Tax=Xenoophorus captivus TaxID=1517983 RepID=A0ABV0RLD0_9TELE
MNTFGSQQALNASRRVGSKGDLTGGGTYQYARSDVAHGGGNGYDVFVEGYRGSSISRKSMKGGGMMSIATESGPMGGMSGSMSTTHRAFQQQSLCNDYLKKAEYCLQAGTGDVEYFMGMARDALEKLKGYAFEMSQLGQPNENIVRSVEHYSEQLKGFHMGMSSNMLRRRSTRKSSGGLDESERRFCDAMAWISQQKAGTNTYEAVCLSQNLKPKPNPSFQC